MKTLLEFIQSALLSNGQQTLKWVMHELEDTEVEKLKQMIGLDLQGFKRKIDTNAVRHVFKKHGNEEAELKRGQIGIVQEDFLLIEVVVSKPDILVIGMSKLGNRVIFYEKTFPEFRFFYVEEIRTGRKEIMMQTFYKTKIRR
ncbi:MAG: hypothetical protein JNL02_01490 [Saprospiraceae bacterium]|nr:hypothetical protein [Saprospiraceae bacterium]